MKGWEIMMKRVKRAALAMQRYSWEQGVLAQAFLEDGNRDMAILMAAEGAYRSLPDGRCCEIGSPGAVTDPCTIGEALIAACEATGDAALCRARDELLAWALHRAPRNGQGILYHFTHSPVFWVDSMYMLPPFLARAGYHEEALRQLDGWWEALYDAEKGLLSHQWNDGSQRFDRREIWGVGNGWAMAGMARVIALLPPAHPGRARLIRRVQALIAAALPHQLPDGAFRDVLDDPTTFREVNFAQMLAYTIYRGVSGGWLDAALLPHAEKARAAALAEVDAYGLVRNVCGAPHFDRPGVAPEGQAFHILMEAARAACTQDAAVL